MMELIFTWVGFICSLIIAILSTILSSLLMVGLIVSCVEDIIWLKIKQIYDEDRFVRFLKAHLKEWESFK